MKKRALFFVIVLFVNIVSASYTCSIGNIIKDDEYVDIGEVASINKMGVGLISPSSRSAAEIILDAKHITLNNLSSSQDIELLSGDYKISLVKITGNSATIEVEGSKEEIEVNKLEKVGGLQIYALNLVGTYPGEDAKLELLAGSKYAFIYEKEPSITETFSGIEYLIEVPYSSNTEAMISVKKCEKGTIIKVNDSVEEGTENIDNSTLPDGTQNQSKNESSNDGNAAIENVTDLEGEEKNIPKSNILSSLIKYNLYIIPTTIFVILVFVFYFFYKKYKNKSDKKQNSKI